MKRNRTLHSTPHDGAGPAARRRGGGVGGFTLLEVMFTIAIFGIGLIAIASIFPVAGRMQKNTMDDVVAQQVKRNALAVMEAHGFSGTALTAGGANVNDPDVQPVPPALLDASSGSVRWPLSARSYPATQPLIEPDNPSASPVGQANRDFYWVPLVRNVNAGAGTPNWQVFIFTLVGAENTDYSRMISGNVWANYEDGEAGQNNFSGPSDTWDVPGVLKVDVSAMEDSDGRYFIEFGSDADIGSNDLDDDGLPDQLLAGDWILTNNGVIHNVIFAEDDRIEVGFLSDPATVDAIWYSPPPSPGQPSPAKGIILVPNAVK